MNILELPSDTTPDPDEYVRAARWISCVGRVDTGK